MEHDLLGKCSPVAAVAFKYLEKAKHRSDILNGLKVSVNENFSTLLDFGFFGFLA